MNRKAKISIVAAVALGFLVAITLAGRSRVEGFAFLSGQKPIRVAEDYDQFQDAVFVRALYRLDEPIEEVLPRIEIELADQILAKRWSSDRSVEYTLRTQGIDLVSDRNIVVEQIDGDSVSVVYNDRQEPSVVHKLGRVLNRHF